MVDFFLGANTLARAARTGLQKFRGRVHEHDATAIGLDPFENQLHDPLQKLIDVECVADGQGGAVHYLQVAACPGQPGVLRHFGLRIENSAAFLLAHCVHDAGAFVLLLGRTISTALARSSPVSSLGPVKSISVLPICN